MWTWNVLSIWDVYFDSFLFPLSYIETNLESENAHSAVQVDREKKISIYFIQNYGCLVYTVRVRWHDEIKKERKSRNNLEWQERREQIQISFVKEPTTFKKINQHWVEWFISFADVLFIKNLRFRVYSQMHKSVVSKNFKFYEMGRKTNNDRRVE